MYTDYSSEPPLLRDRSPKTSPVLLFLSMEDGTNHDCYFPSQSWPSLHITSPVVSSSTTLSPRFPANTTPASASEVCVCASCPCPLGTLVTMGVLVLVLLDQPVLHDGGGLSGSGALLALDLDGHALVLLERGGEVGLLGGLGGGGLLEGEDLALGIVLLDGWYLVGLKFFEVEFLDEVGC